MQTTRQEWRAKYESAQSDAVPIRPEQMWHEVQPVRKPDNAIVVVEDTGSRRTVDGSMCGSGVR